jgi:salicylate hydroxylase
MHPDQLERQRKVGNYDSIPTFLSASGTEWISPGWNTIATAEDVVETFKDFSPLVVNMLKKAQNVKCWQLLERDVIPSWVKGRVCLVGDAAHPMLPRKLSPSLTASITYLSRH